ncbi:DNA-3-methyladenine glycosylase [Deinococcus alpinitundrae]|uniref:DNA-3-methyladenine glycosylase n=1 Tax=Deinococcus alpinitundrae TaxID=468913 RepID=UPI00137ABE25|nr:DNA-3-methyladenine glycosylase [Deinococcus alpinitundrae]
MPAPFSPAHFDANPVELARNLLGATLRRTLPDGRVLAGRIVEVEAYDCPRDPSCTAGRFHHIKTLELEAAPGRFVFWVAYGHPLLQIACRAEGIPASVLIRALEPLEGVDAMLEHRPVVSERNLLSGPAKLVQALALPPEQFRGQPVNGAALCLLPGVPLSDDQVTVTARVGIAAGRNLPWRFFETGSKWLSSGLPSMDLATSNT